MDAAQDAVTALGREIRAAFDKATDVFAKALENEEASDGQLRLQKALDVLVSILPELDDLAKPSGKIRP